MTKIRTFPTPHPDELLYSIFARYHSRVRVRGKYPKDTLEQLFGSRTATATYDFPTRLQDLCDRLPDDLEFSPATIIKRRTLLPFYSPFLPPERLAAITTKMVKSDKCGSIHAMIGCNSSNFTGDIALTHLRYCPLCLKENRAEFGEGYWHRSHQLPGVVICHMHHVPLLKSRVQINNRINKLNFHALEQEFSAYDLSCLPNGDISEIDIWLAKKSHWLLSVTLPNHGLDVLKVRYCDLLIKNGLSSLMGKIKHKEFSNRFTNYYGEKKLAEYFCHIKLRSRSSWLMNVVQKTNQVLSPLRHLLLIKFLGSDPEAFLSDYVEANRPFGEGPYPCLNPVCSQHNKPVITKVNVSRNTHTGNPFGNFKCDKCGFTYGRTGPDVCPEDKFKRSKIIDVGVTWNQELLRLNADPTQNLKQISKSLGVDPGTVKRHLAKPKEGNKKIISNKYGTAIKKLEYRQILINTICENKDITRSSLRIMMGREFNWLYRNDHDWLYENLPNSQNRIGLTSRVLVDWAKKDKEFAIKVKEAICKIHNDTGKLRRITLTLIGSMIGNTTSLRKKLDNLPETKTILENNLESIEDFQIRRIQSIAQKIIDEGNAIFRWELIRKAGLLASPMNLSPRIENEINRQIERSP